jgi:hypothetical protein
VAAFVSARFVAEEIGRAAAEAASYAIAGSARFGFHSEGADDLAGAATEAMAVRAICRGAGNFSCPGVAADSFQDADVFSIGPSVPR